MKSRTDTKPEESQPSTQDGVKSETQKVEKKSKKKTPVNELDLNMYVLTNGGPLHATEVPSTLMISMLFLRNRYGMGSTIAVLLIILCFAFALLINRIFKEEG